MREQNGTEKLHVLVTIPMDPDQRRRLEAVRPEGEYRYVPEVGIMPETSPLLTAREVEDADVILGDVPSEMLRGCRHLQFLQLSSAGVREYIGGALPEGAALSNATGAYGEGISETMLAMTLVLMKKLHLYQKQQQEHSWSCLGRVKTLQNAVVLCVGMGNIGGEYLKKCKALGAYTCGVCRTLREKPDWADELHVSEELDALLPRADVVAVNLPDTPKTRRMLDERRLSLLKKEAILINVGRGAAVDTDALCRMLNEEKLAGAGLDVTDPEPLPPEHPLWDARNALITPHVTGGFTLERTLENIVALAIENFARFVAGQPARNQVDFQEGYARKDPA